jgi:hypothetical protein
LSVFFQPKLTDDKIDNLIDAFSDSMFNYAVDETARLRLGRIEAGFKHRDFAPRGERGPQG